jgi:thioredoxin reductase
MTFFVNDAIKLDQTSRDSLTKRGARIEEQKITRFEGHIDSPVEVVLNVRTKVEVKSIFVVTKFRVASPFAKELGCALISTPRGEIMQTDEWKMTSLGGVYAASSLPGISLEQHIAFHLRPLMVPSLVLELIAHRRRRLINHQSSLLNGSVAS